MTETISIGELLSKGYFPKELPPAFSTSTFGSVSGALEIRKKEPSTPARVNLARPGGLRRGLSIPNPEAQIRVVSSIVANWSSIAEIYDRSVASLSRPIRGMNRALEPMIPFFDVSAERAHRAFRARFTVKMDVSQHYGSIYTHSIPWAVLGKAEEKQRSSTGGPTTFSNDLDSAVRSAQDKQTTGIPIGPDTSLVISELLLSNVDERVMSKHSGDSARFLRYMDDFEYYASSRSEGEEVLADWESALAEYELQINPLKTEIIDGPPRIQSLWKTQLSQFRVREDNGTSAANDVREYMGLAFELRRSYPTDPVLSYAISRAANTLRPLTEPWVALLEMSLAAVTVEPSSLPHLATAMYKAAKIDVTIDREALSAALSGLVERHAPLQHGVEVSWALWLLRRYAATLDSFAAAPVARMADNTALLLVRDLVDVGLVDGDVDLSSIEVRVSESDLQDSDWLLAYEYAGHGWASPDNVSAHPFFGQIATARIRFFDAEQAIRQAPAVGRAPVY